MAKRTKTRSQAGTSPRGAKLRRWGGWGLLSLMGIVLALVGAVAVVPPPTTPYIWSEARRLGGVEREWVPMERIAPVMGRAAVAAEDADFCNHWGFDMSAIRAAIRAGGTRGGSTITQQVAKNVYLWQGRTWLRKAFEAGLTPLVEAIWPKRRILEVYLNVAEFDTGVFGVEAAARQYFGVAASDLSATQASRLAAVLPDPKGRSAAQPGAGLERRVASIRDGAALIGADGRAACFETG